MSGDRLPSTIPPPQASWKDGFPRRLGVFLVGIAIGFIVLGFFQRMRQAAAQRTLAERERQVDQAQSPGQTPAQPAPAPAAGGDSGTERP